MSEESLIRVRWLIAQLEFVTAQANLDLQRGGEWRVDYSSWHGEINQKIEALMGSQEAKR